MQHIGDVFYAPEMKRSALLVVFLHQEKEAVVVQVPWIGEKPGTTHMCLFSKHIIQLLHFDKSFSYPQNRYKQCDEALQRIKQAQQVTYRALSHTGS